MEPLVSIVVPLFNGEKTIFKCIESLVNQSYCNIEIIIVNDGSSDRSVDIVNKLIKKFGNIKLYNIENHGVSYARNYGICKSNGEYLAFVDADDYVNYDFIKVLLLNIINNDSDLSCCGYNVFEEYLNWNISSNDCKIVTDKYASLFQKNKGFLWNKMYKASIIKEQNIKLNENIHMCEDLIFNFEYLKHANNVVFTPCKLYGYFVSHDNTFSRVNDKWYTIFDAYNILFKEYLKIDDITDDLIILNYLFTVFEARVRSKMQNYNFSLIGRKYNINYREFLKNYYSRILFNNRINLKDKFRLTTFYFLFPISYIIKFMKLKG